MAYILMTEKNLVKYNFLGEKIYPEAVASKDYLEIANTLKSPLVRRKQKLGED